VGEVRNIGKGKSRKETIRKKKKKKSEVNITKHTKLNDDLTVKGL
jgi:hypothetical protein